MKWIPTPAAYELLHDGQLALSDIESNGCRVDRDYIEKSYRETQERIRDLESQMRADPIYNVWRRRFGERTNVGSPEQLAAIVFGKKSDGYLGYHAPRATSSGKRASAAEAALEVVSEPFVKKLYLPCQKLRKACGTYLAGIMREMVQHDDGLYYVHPNYNLNTVETYRSSASDPNYQNNPARNPEIGELIRRCYIPRSGRQLLEIDYSQIEVRISCCYHKDPVMIEYVCDPTKDMHRDMAAQIFMLDAKQVSKETRSHVKNKYVFPSFYGSYYAQIAPNLWGALDQFQLKVEGAKKEDGTSLTVKEHLASKGITELGLCDPKEQPAKGTFEYHLKEIEEDFWGRRFKVYAQWKRDWLEAYYRDGGCRFLTGFIMTGSHKRNDITNYAIQGSSFHCLLWSLIKINRWLRRYKMKTLVIGEVHDSGNFDADPRERDDVIDFSVRTMTKDIRSWAPWLNIPLDAEPELCPIDASWFEKSALKEEGGRWVPASMKKWTERYGDWQLQTVG